MIDLITKEDGFFDSLAGKLFLFFMPFIIASFYILLLYTIIANENIFWVVGGGISAYFFPPFGKESVIPGTISVLMASKYNLSAPAIITLVSGSIAFVDVVTSYFLLWNFYIAEKIPFVGKWIKRFEEFGAQKMKEKAWISKIAFVGVALFVVFPFQGSGGVGGSILGKVIGMNKYQAWFAIITGSFVGCFMIGIISYYLGGAVLSAFRSSIFKGVGVLILIIVVFIFLYYFSKNHVLKNKEKKV